MTTTAEKTGENSGSIIDRWAKNLFVRFMNHIEHGQLKVSDGDEEMIFGTKGDLSAHVTVLDPRFYSKMILGGSVGAGEAYIAHYWDTNDLVAVVRVFARNLNMLNRLEKSCGWLLQPYRLVQHRRNRNNRSGAKRNIISHYDLGNDLYATFLDSRMMYSSAIYSDDSSDLEEATGHKLDIICQKLELKPGDSVIEIGSGWGGFAIHAAAHYGCKVTTTTISEAQYEEAKKRIEAAELEDRITLLKKDYRDLDGSFDKLVSIEMIEAVGHEYLEDYFAKCSSLLKSSGRMLLQAITICDQAYDQYLKGVDFIQRHVFPGGCLVANKVMFDLIARKTDMVVRALEDYGLDYARTLKDWRIAFGRSTDELELKGYDDRFRRLWNYYLAYCEGGFRERWISVVHLVATKPDYR
ncbi:MAG: class I SAM-dependent methyltransferase [Desulfofustis sp.]|nr:class I SAM-dependent methyltransferase [Desulfofustis sp.]